MWTHKADHWQGLMVMILVVRNLTLSRFKRLFCGQDILGMRREECPVELTCQRVEGPDLSVVFLKYCIKSPF